MTRLEAEGVPYGNINNYREAFEHPQAIHRGMRVEMPSPSGEAFSCGVANPVRFSATPVRYARSAPKLGLDTAEVTARFAPGRAT